MDLRLALRVLWRFRFLVVLGVAAALALALLAYVRVRFDGGAPELTYRGHETWQSESLLLITQHGFPWGRSVIDTGTQSLSGETVPTTAGQEPRFADSSRFSGLAALYATLATSDAVRQALLRGGPIGGRISASPVLTFETLPEENRPQFKTESPLPVIRITAQATHPDEAQTLAQREVAAFLGYLEEKQRSNGIRRKDRVVVSVLDRPGRAHLVEGRSKLYPALVFLGLTGLTILSAFALENLRPQVRGLAHQPADGSREGHRVAQVEPPRRSAVR